MNTVKLVPCPVCNGSGTIAGQCLDLGRPVIGCYGGACPHEHTDDEPCGECRGTGRVAEGWEPRGMSR